MPNIDEEERDIEAELDFQATVELKTWAQIFKRAARAIEDRQLLREKLAEVEKKYDKLLTDSVRHAEAMSGQVLNLCLKIADKDQP